MRIFFVEQIKKTLRNPMMHPEFQKRGSVDCGSRKIWSILQNMGSVIFLNCYLVHLQHGLKVNMVTGNCKNCEQKQYFAEKSQGCGGDTSLKLTTCH